QRPVVALALDCKGLGNERACGLDVAGLVCEECELRERVQDAVWVAEASLRREALLEQAARPIVIAPRDREPTEGLEPEPDTPGVAALPREVQGVLEHSPRFVDLPASREARAELPECGGLLVGLARRASHPEALPGPGDGGVDVPGDLVRLAEQQKRARDH